MVYYHADRRDVGERQPFGRGNGTRDTEDIVEGEVVDSQAGFASGGGKGKTPEERVEEFLRSVAAGIKKDKKTELKEAVARSRRIRRAEQALGNPGKGSGIVVRHQGLLHRETSQDSARFEAQKANHDHAVLLSDFLVNFAKLIAIGKRTGMELFDYLMELDSEYSAALAPQAELMTDWGMEKYLDTFQEVLDMYPGMRLEDIARAMLVHPTVWRS
jgi:hypothetical protein